MSRNLSEKTFIFTRRKIDKEEVVIADRKLELPIPDARISDKLKKQPLVLIGLMSSFASDAIHSCRSLTHKH